MFPRHQSLFQTESPLELLDLWVGEWFMVVTVFEMSLGG